jgi:hypothetical protein
LVLLRDGVGADRRAADDETIVEKGDGKSP